MRHARLVLPLLVATALGGCDLDDFRAVPLRPPADLLEEFAVNPDDLETTSSGLQYADVQRGSGETAAAGRVAVVHYTGRLTSGETFDSSRERAEPFAPQSEHREEIVDGAYSWFRRSSATGRGRSGRSRRTRRWSSTSSCWCCASAAPARS